MPESHAISVPEANRSLVRAVAGAETRQIRRAEFSDIPEIEALITHYARRNRMLFRTAAELMESLSEFVVARGPLPEPSAHGPISDQLGAKSAVEDGGAQTDALLGVCGLHAVGQGLAEVRGLAVHPDAGGRGIGRALVEACVRVARDAEIAKVYTLTLEPRFFERLGFVQVDRGTLHLKVWYECYKCPKFANCDETAMIRPLDLE